MQTYGVQAVYGRVMTCKEINTLNYTQSLIAIYRAATSADNIAAWMKDNPRDAAIFNEASLLAGESNG